MATLTVAATGAKIQADAEVAAFLQARGIEFERWPVRAGDLLQAYRPELDRLAREKGYIDADVIRLSPETPNLETLLAKFDKDHYHTDDEVRFIHDGEGVFGLMTAAGEKFEILVQIGKSSRQMERVWLRVKESFRLALVAKIKKGEAAIDFTVVDPAFGPVMTALEGDFGVSVLFIPFNAVISNTRTEWQRVQAYDERFSVKMAPLQLLGF